MQFLDSDTLTITLKRGVEHYFDYEHTCMLDFRKFAAVEGGVLILCSSDRPAALRNYLDSCPAVLEYLDSGGLHRKRQPRKVFARVRAFFQPSTVPA